MFRQIQMRRLIKIQIYAAYLLSTESVKSTAERCVKLSTYTERNP